MAKSNKPLVWAPFAAGGTISAFLTPVLIVLTLMVALGHAPDLLAYDRLRDFAAHGLTKIAIVGVVFLTLWSAAHRLRITCYDFGVRADTLVATVVYAIAIIATIAAAVGLGAV
jgi:fumarate reductase subunit D